MDGQISRNLIFNVESQHEDDDDGVVEPVDDRILDDQAFGPNSGFPLDFSFDYGFVDPTVRNSVALVVVIVVK